MKKYIIIIAILLVVAIGVLFGVNAVMANKAEKDLYLGLNGYSLSNTANQKIADFVTKYQNSNFIDGEGYYVLCDDVSKFKEYTEKAHEIDEILAIDPFTVVENLDIYDSTYDDVSKYYNHTGEEYLNNEYVEEVDNKYCIKYKNLHFDNNEFMEIKNGRFSITVFQKDIAKLTFAEAQDKMYVEKVGKKVEFGGTIYYYYNNFTHLETAIRIEVRYGVVTNVERL